MYRCGHNDCFTCPFSDCVSDTGPKGEKKKRKKLTKEEARERKKETNRKYYYKNREKISELHRNSYQKKKKG